VSSIETFEGQISHCPADLFDHSSAERNQIGVASHEAYPATVVNNANARVIEIATKDRIRYRFPMSDWLHTLPFWWMALAVFGITYLAAAGIFTIIMVLAKGDRGRHFKGVSTSLLSPLGTIFGLLVVFILAQVWSDIDRAQLAVDHEASALRMVVLLSECFGGQPESDIRGLVRRHVDEAVFSEWPMMAQNSASLKVSPQALSDALQTVLSIEPKGEGQIAAQREMVTSFENAFDARRQRIILSRSSVNWIKWSCLFAQAACVLVTIAVAHSDNRVAAAISMGIFASGVAVSVVLIASHDRPFSGPIAVQPDVLLQVRPDSYDR
jgi:hypothetical protein